MNDGVVPTCLESGTLAAIFVQQHPLCCQQLSGELLKVGWGIANSC